MSVPLNVYMIGAQKAGTTSLAFLLDQHPDICLSVPKEPDFFTKHWDKGFDWYQQRYECGYAKVYLDASTSYSLARFSNKPVVKQVLPFSMVPPRIFDLSPKAKFIYILREPIARTYSAYWHSVRSGVEARSFQIAVMNDLGNPDNFYLRGSHYYAQLSLYLEKFPLESFLILFFEDLKKDQKAVVNKCFDFLQVEPVEVIDEQAKNQSYTYNSMGKMFGSLLQKNKSLWIEKMQARIPKVVKSAGKRFITTKIPTIEKQDGEHLSAYFQQPNKDLESLIGLNIDQWKN